MARPRMDLTAFVGKLLEEQDGDVLREGVQVLAQALMESEVTTLVEAWKRYVQSLWPSLTAKEHDEIRAIGLDRARHVAEAASGFLGLTSKISAAKHAALDEMARRLAG